METIYKINLADYKNICMRYDVVNITASSSYAAIGVVQTASYAPSNSSVYGSFTTNNVISSNQIAKLGIPNVDSGIVTVSALQGCEIHVHEIWLEK
jgi:hypothetical protein